MTTIKRNKKPLFLIFLFFLSMATISGQETDRLFNKANEEYSKGNFKQAAEIYRTIADQGYISEDLYFNLGNAYYKSGDIPSAILFYEKSLKLNPADADTRFNLKLANQKTADKIEPLPELALKTWWRNILFSRKANSWAWLTIQSLFLAGLLFAAFLFSKNIFLKKAGFFSGSILIIASVLFFIFGYQQKRITDVNDYAIIYSPSLIVRSAPDNTGTKLFVIHEGTKVQVLDSLSEWKKISIPNGSTGWIKAEAMEKI